jgi:hypothetical protein
LEREGEREELSRRKHTRLLEGRKKAKLLPGAPIKLLEAGVRTKSWAKSDMDLKTISVIDNVNKKRDTAVCNLMILEERRLSDDAQNFQNLTPNNSNIWRQDIRFKSSGRSDLAGHFGETTRSLKGDNGSCGGC